MNYYNFMVLIIVGMILLISAWRGYSVGVIKMALSVAALIATLFVARLIAVPVGNMIKENTDIYQNLEKSITEVIETYALDNQSAIKELPFPEYMLDEAVNATQGVETIKTEVVSIISKQIFDAVVYIVLNIVVFIAIRICMSVFRIIERMPLIKEVNHLAGFVLGLAEGLILIWLLAVLLQAFAGESWAQEAFRQINDNAFLKILYELNPLIKIIGI